MVRLYKTKKMEDYIEIESRLLLLLLLEEEEYLDRDAFI